MVQALKQRKVLQSIVGVLGGAVIAASAASCGGDSESTTIFELVVENVAPVGALTGTFGDPQEIAFAVGLGAVHVEQNPLYTVGRPAGGALEKFAEDADPTDLIEAVQADENVTVVVFATTPTQENAGGGVLLPGQSYRVVFNAESSQSRLSFALPFFQANDTVLGTGDAGVPLFNADGSPRSGDITADFSFLDAGTEVNEPIAQGSNQIVSQRNPNTGATESGVVSPVTDPSFPSVAGSVRVTVNLLQRVD